MNPSDYARWLELLTQNARGLRYVASFVRDVMNGDQPEEGKTQTIRVYVDEEGNLLRPYSNGSPAWSHIPRPPDNRRKPLSQIILDQSVDTVLWRLNDPTGESGAACEARVEQAQYTLGQITVAFRAFIANPVMELCVPGFQIEEYKASSAKVFHDYLTKTKAGLTVEAVKKSVLADKATIEEYLAWQKRGGRPSKETECEVVI